jgi:UDP-N-acetylmuramoyl-tripeptide--D-alanyl-D-alanine ligase
LIFIYFKYKINDFMKLPTRRFFDAVSWRLHRLLGDRIVYGSLLKAAKVWRRVLKKTAFVGIAGSAGKTTAKELFTGMFANYGGAAGNRGTFNNIEEIAKAMLFARPSHRGFVSELSEHLPGEVARQATLLAPSVGIVTVVKDDHLAAFASRDAIAAEMQALVTSLPATGTAVLNADDPLVLAMASHSRAKVLTYGLSSQAELRAEDVSSAWPQRLQMTLVYRAQRVKLVTQLCGTHWIPSVLGAIGGGLASGLTLEECATGIASVPPFEGRMQPVTTPDGVTFIRDDFKAPLWAMDACFDFMKAATAKRKIIVIGEISEIVSKKGNKYAKAAARAQEVADVVLFVGPWASSVLAARLPGRPPGDLQVFGHVRDAARYLHSMAQEGDLVLLKGSAKKDHLLRVILARGDGVACWRDDCQRTVFCDACPDRMKPSGLPEVLRPSLEDQPTACNAPTVPFAPAVAQPVDEPGEAQRPMQLVIGLGNQDALFAGTPHNVGFEVVDALAQAWGLNWEATPLAWLARGEISGHRACLVKLRSDMNLTGTGLRQVADAIGVAPHQCILVFDDLATPIGQVRTRLNGGAGGHRGVASALQAFQTHDLRRVKLGIATEASALDWRGYVATKFSGDNRPWIDAAIPVALNHIVELVSRK